MNETSMISYWATMLDEAMADKAGEIVERRMNGPASGNDEIRQFREKLASGVVEFEFTKRDGTRRRAVGTTSEQVFPTSERRRLDPSYDENLASYERRSAFIIWFWDLEKNSVRCFNTNRFENLISYQRTSAPLTDPGIERVGNIFISRDTDGEDGAADDRLTPERADEITREIRREIVSDGVSSFDHAIAATEADGVTVEISPSGEPVLRIEIDRRWSDVMGSYQIALPRLRQHIRDRWNVEIKRVEIAGVFRFD